MNKNMTSNLSNTHDKTQFINLIKIGIIRQLHAEQILDDKQYKELLTKNKVIEFDNPPCLQ